MRNLVNLGEILKTQKIIILFWLARNKKLQFNEFVFQRKEQWGRNPFMLVVLHTIVYSYKNTDCVCFLLMFCNCCWEPFANEIL